MIKLIKERYAGEKLKTSLTSYEIERIADCVDLARLHSKGMNKYISNLIEDINDIITYWEVEESVSIKSNKSLYDDISKELVTFENDVDKETSAEDWVEIFYSLLVRVKNEMKVLDR